MNNELLQQFCAKGNVKCQVVKTVFNTEQQKKKEKPKQTKKTSYLLVEENV